MAFKSYYQHQNVCYSSCLQVHYIVLISHYHDSWDWHLKWRKLRLRSRLRASLRGGRTLSFLATHVEKKSIKGTDKFTLLSLAISTRHVEFSSMTLFTFRHRFPVYMDIFSYTGLLSMFQRALRQDTHFAKLYAAQRYFILSASL